MSQALIENRLFEHFVSARRNHLNNELIPQLFATQYMVLIMQVRQLFTAKPARFECSSLCSFWAMNRRQEKKKNMNEEKDTK